MALMRIRGVADSPTLRSLWLWCPACEDAHRITIGGPNTWTWDGNETAPTISPSLKVSGAQWPEDSDFYRANHRGEPGDVTICHSFIRAGRWEFLGDCTHALAGQTVPMVALPEWLDA